MAGRRRMISRCAWKGAKGRTKWKSREGKSMHEHIIAFTFNMCMQFCWPDQTPKNKTEKNLPDRNSEHIKFPHGNFDYQHRPDVPCLAVGDALVDFRKCFEKREHITPWVGTSGWLQKHRKHFAVEVFWLKNPQMWNSKYAGNNTPLRTVVHEPPLPPTQQT